MFAVLHVYWALGGDVGLASSAGAELADRRPLGFVLGGLWGTALLLLGGAVFAVRLARGRSSRPMVLLAGLVGIVLLARGIVVELLLLTDAFGVATAVGPFETRWSLVLWNPWFVLGGCLFVLAGRRARISPRPARCS